MKKSSLSELIAFQRAGYWGADPGLAEVDIHVIRNGDILESGEVRWSRLPLRSLGRDEAAKASVSVDDILITTSGECGFVAHVPSEPPTRTVATNFVRILRVDPLTVCARYAFYFMHREAFRSALVPFIRGTTMKNLAVADALARVEMPLPSLNEQQQIAEVLDRAEALRAKRRAALAQFDTLTQSLFLDLFGKPKENPKHWPLVLLMDLCSPKQWPTITTTQLIESGFPVFGANGLIGCYSDYNHEEPTVLVTCRGATCGTINVSPAWCYVTGNAMALDAPDSTRLTLEYLESVLRMRGLQDTISGSAQPQITRQSLEPVRVPLPPLELQHDFACRVAAIERLKSAQRASLVQLDALFASLQHRAFRGELWPS